MKEYNFTELLKETTDEERMFLAYNIIQGFDKGVIGKTLDPGIRFTSKKICEDEALIAAYEKVYPVSDGFEYQVVTYDNDESWIETTSNSLANCIEEAYVCSEKYSAVEVMAVKQDYDNELILYIGTPADTYNYDTDGPIEVSSIGCMRIAEFQDVEHLIQNGLYLKGD